MPPVSGASLIPQDRRQARPTQADGPSLGRCYDAALAVGERTGPAVIRVGDRVRITAIPPDVAGLADDADELGTEGVFRQCLGLAFRVRGIDEHGHLELWVHGRDDGHPHAYLESIWVEPAYVE